MVFAQRNPMSQVSLTVACSSTPMMPKQPLRYKFSFFCVCNFPIIFPSVSLIAWSPDSRSDRPHGQVQRSDAVAAGMEVMGTSYKNYSSSLGSL